MTGRQLSLLPDDGVPRARVETSYRAAVAVAPVVRGRRLAVLELFRAAGERGLTDPEIAAAMGLPLQSAVPLRHWLAGRELIVRAWVTRQNEHGRSCNVWRLR